MRCPFCHVDNDRVTDSRASEDGYVIRRRRLCLSCDRRFTTHERLHDMTLKVIKKDGTREPFKPEKLREGISKACWKRPVSEEDIDRIIRLVEDALHGDFELEAPTHMVGEIVMQELAKLDQVAYVRYASVYREFKDARDFFDELQPMLEEVGQAPKKG